MSDTVALLPLAANEAEDRYQSILNSLDTPVIRWLPDGTVTFANNAYFRLKGIDRESFTHIDPERCVYCEDVARAKAAIAALGPSRPSFEIELRIVDADGNIRWMLWTYRVILDAAHRIVEYQGSGLEVTDRMAAEDQARQTQRLLRSMIDALPVCIAYVGPDCRYQLLNNTYEKWFGLDRSDMIGRHVKDVIGEQAFEKVFPAVQAALAGETSEYEGPTAYRAAGDRYVKASYVPDFGADGTVHGFFSVVTDLSERVRADRALEESETRFRRLIESSPDIILVHIDGRILYVNEAGVRHLNLRRADQLIGRCLNEFIDPAHIELARAVSAGAGSDAPPVFHELVLRRDDGTTFDAEVAAIQLIYEGRPAVQLICRDITARKNAQAQLMQSAKLATLGEMAAGMAHELNQPLNVIRMAAENSLFMIDEDDVTDTAVHRSQFEAIAGQSIRMASIIDHMRDFSRIDDERATPLNPFDVVRRACAFFAEIFRTENIALDLELTDEDIVVLGHEILLEQLFVGLLQNATDAILERKADGDGPTPDGHIAIIAERPGVRPLVSISISDNGGGIVSPILERIFEPFVTSKPVGKGTGLGLSVGNEIVKRMNGRITVENVADGARFTVTLPLHNATA